MSKLDLAVVLDLIDKVSAPAKKIRGVTSHLNKQLDNTLSSIKNLNTQQKQVKDFSRLNSALGTQNQKLDDARGNFKRLQQQLRATQAPTQALKTKVTKAAKQVHALSEQQQNLRLQLNKGRQALKAQGVDTRNLTTTQKKLEHQLGKTEKRYQSYKKIIRTANIGKRLGTKALGAGKFVGGAVGVGFAAIFSQLKSAADQADAIATIADNLKIDSFNLQALRFQGELNGVSGDQIDQALTRFSKRMGRLKGDSGAIFGLLKKTDKAFANTLKHAGSNDQAFALMTEYIANIKDAQKQSALADAAFGQTGRNMLIMLRQGEKGILESRQEFAKFGGGASKSFQKNAGDFNTKLFLIGQLIKSIKFKVLGPILEKVTGKLQVFLNQFKSSEGAKQFIDQMVLKINKLLFVFEEIFSAAKEFLSLLGRVKEFVGGWKNLAIIIASIKLLPLVSAIGSLINLLTTLAVRQKIITAAQWLWNAALTANPIGLVITGVGALIGAGVLLVKNWKPVVSWFNGVIDSIAKKFSWIGKLWGNLFGSKKVAAATINQTVKQSSSKVVPISRAIKQSSGSVAPLRLPAGPKIVKARFGRNRRPVQQNNSVQITVNPAPGMDERQLASMVQQQLEQAQRNQQSKARAALYDTP